MTPDQIQQARDRAEMFLDRTSYFAQLGLEAASSDARMLAHAVIDLAQAVEDARNGEATLKRRHDEYVAYHREHCFNPDGTTRSGTPAPPGDHAR